MSDKVLGDTGTLCSDGVQQGIVAEHFLIQQLKQQRGVTLSINCAFFLSLDLLKLNGSCDFKSYNVT